MGPNLAILVVFVSWLGISPVLANPALTPPAVNEELRDAIQNLDDSSYRVRTQAAKKLLGAGQAAVEPLVAIAKSGSIESADRALKILERMTLEGSDETVQAAREALRRLAQTRTQAREQAREILKRQRGLILDRIQEAGARFQFDDDKVRAVYLNTVQDLKAVLPLLREIPELEEVSLENKQFGDDDMKYLLPLKNLRWLNLFSSNIGDDGLKHLKNFPKLESIPMGWTRVTDEGLKHLADLTQLNYVGLRGNNITDAGLVHLKKLTNLTGLTFEETKVSGAGFDHLKAMSKLTTLRLHTAPIDDDGLAKLHGIKSLRRIELRGTKVTREGVEKLREAIPEAAVIANIEQ